MQKVSPEIFTTFCTFLSPADLFTLSQVCHKFREYLCAQNSFSTQQIWKESRLRFMPEEDMLPPEGMSEEKYVSLLMTERGCQFCKCKICEIYWEFEVRCCYECFSKKTKYIQSIWSYYSHDSPVYPQKFLSVMPYVNDYFIYDNEYWKEQIEIAYSQYKGLSNENLQSWLDDKKHKFDSIMNYAKQRKLKENETLSYRRYRGMVIRRYREMVVRSFYSHPPSPLFPSFSNLVLDSSSYNDNNNNNNENVQLIQFHIRRLENYEQKNIVRNSDGLKRNNFIETKKKKKKREYYSKHNEFHMKGKNPKNKIVHKYG